MGTLRVRRKHTALVKWTVSALLVLVACDARVTPSVELSSIAISLREVELFSTVGSTTSDTAIVTISNNGGGSISGVTLQDPTYIGEASGWLIRQLQDTTLWLSATAENLDTGAYSASVDVLLTGASNSPRSIAVTFFVGESEQIVLSENSLTFTATEGGVLPPGQSVSVSNGGDGVLRELQDTVSYTGPEENWIEAMIGSNTAPTSVQVAPQLVLPPGTHNAVLRVRSPLSIPETDSVRIAFVVAPRPAVLISADEIAIDAVEGSSEPIVSYVTVDEKNRRTLTATVQPGAAWLSTAADTIVTPTELGLIADPRGLPVGPHQGLAIVSSGVTDADTVVVNLTIRMKPTVEASIRDVEFTALTGLDTTLWQVVRIENAGAYPLVGLEPTVVPDSNWLSAVLDRTAAPAALTLRVDPAQVVPGTTTLADVIIRGGSNAREDTIRVSFELADSVPPPDPALTVTASKVVFRVFQRQGIPDPQVVTVSNRAGGALDGVYVSASSVPNWLRVSPISRSRVPTPTPLVLEVTSTDLTPSSYPGTLEIVSESAGIDPVELDVVLEVDSGPTIMASPVGITMTGIAGINVPDIEYVAVSNAGRGDLGSIIADTKNRWMSAEVDSSVTPTRVIVTAYPTDVTVGSHNGAVTIHALNARNAVTVPITFDVVPPPDMGLSPTKLVFHATVGDTELPDSQAVSIFDVAGRSLGEITVDSTSWLSAIVESATVPATIVVQPNEVLDVLESPYTDTITVRSNVATNSPQRLPVIYYIDVGGRPVIRILPQGNLTFGRDNPPAQTVSIINGGGGTLRDLRVVDDSSSAWLFVLLDSRIAPAKLTVAIDPSKVAEAPPNSVATLRISGAEAESKILTVLLP